MSEYDADDAEAFRAQLREHITERDNPWVTASRLADEIDASAKRIGNHLSTLADEGLVEKWANGATGATWRVKE